MTDDLPLRMQTAWDNAIVRKIVVKLYTWTGRKWVRDYGPRYR